MIAAGIGSAVMPRLTVDASDPRITVIELGARVPPRMIHVARHRDRYHSPAARAFVETALDIVAHEQLAA
jgi:DNA-binding transcriptional LysR family regulator